MQFNKLINILLNEDTNKEYGILFKDELYLKGNDVPGDVIFNNPFLSSRGYREQAAPGVLGVIKLWKLSSIRKQPRQPDILPMPPGHKPNKTVFIQVYGPEKNKIPASVINNDIINGTIDIDNINNVTSYNVEFTFIKVGSSTSFVVYQSNNKDGTHTTWINPEGLSRPSVVQDFQIVDKNEHQKNLTIQAHKHNDLIDMIDL